MKHPIPALVLVLSIAGCGSDAEPANPQVAQERLGSTLPTLTAAVGDTLAMLDSDRMSELMALADHLPALGLSDGDALIQAADRDDTSEDLDVDELVSLLETKILIDENYEGNGIYRVSGAALCDAGDIECIEDVDALELRIYVAIAGDGLDLALLIGPQNSRPLEVELRVGRLDVFVDLGEIKEAAIALDVDEAELPTTFTGRVRAGITVVGDVATLSAGVTNAIAIAGDFEGQSISFDYGARDPILSATADFGAQTLRFDLDAPAMILAAPWALINDDATGNEDAEIVVAGLSGSLTLEAGLEKLTIENLGLGDETTRVTVGGVDVFTLDLNENSGRRFDMGIEEGELGARVTFDPEFDLEIGTHFAGIDGLDSTPELADSVYAFRAQGQPSVVELVEAEADEYIKVISGSMTVEEVGGASVSAPAGTCLFSELAPEPGAHPVIGSFAAGACP